MFGLGLATKVYVAIEDGRHAQGFRRAVWIGARPTGTGRVERAFVLVFELHAHAFEGPGIALQVLKRKLPRPTRIHHTPARFDMSMSVNQAVYTWLMSPEQEQLLCDALVNLGPAETEQGLHAEGVLHETVNV